MAREDANSDGALPDGAKGDLGGMPMEDQCTDGSWATVAVDDRSKPGGAAQDGAHRVGDGVCAAWSWWWNQQGRPGRIRFGVSAGRHGACRVWLDAPGCSPARSDLCGPGGRGVTHSVTAVTSG
ncbi:hypothetical protein [Streptomyces syringium]|uniref:hypothetical protein n=1 Tax=Streptomyces syringium TaxID=76729 RepID=UPI003428BA38